MKNSFKKLLLILFVSFLATGCVKMDVSMNINKDKSMNLVMIMAVNKQLLEQSGGDSEMIDQEDLKELKEQGFEVEEYKEDSMNGYKASRKIKNIDVISTKDEIASDLSMTNTDSENKYLFTVKKGFLKNKYIANITSSDSKSIEDQMNTLTSPDTTTNDTPNNDLDDFDYSSLMAGMDMKFEVKVPYKALDNNATSVSANGKTLTWNLLELDEDNMHFEFELYNMSTIYIIGGIILLIILGLVLALTKRKNNKNNHINNSNVIDGITIDSIIGSNDVQNIQSNTMANASVNSMVTDINHNAELIDEIPINSSDEMSANTDINNVLQNNGQINNIAFSKENVNQSDNSNVEIDQNNQQS